MRKPHEHITHQFVFGYFIFTGVYKYCFLGEHAVKIGQNSHYENNLTNIQGIILIMS